MTNQSSQNICQPELCTAFSTERDERVAVDQLFQQLNRPDISFVLFFCSAEYQLDNLSRALQQRFKDILVVGCTSAGEITVEGYDQGCISAIGFSRESFAVSGRLISSLENFDFNDAQGVVEQLSEECLAQQVAPIKDHSFALTLFDGLSTQE